MVNIYHSMAELDRLFPNNMAVLDAVIKTEDHLNTHKRIVASISGGSDSDLVLDLLERLGHPEDTEIRYVWFDTGLEYEATKQQIQYLMGRYKVKIETVDHKKAIATSCKTYGVPFLTKTVSDYINRLQRHGFQWEDEPFDVLCARYPGCKAALRWWCNEWGEGSRMNISNLKWLKEFLIAYPPKFKISKKCCLYSKVLPALAYLQEFGADLNIVGVRRAEGGQRATAYTSCFTPAHGNTVAQFRPLFFLRDEDKAQYEEYCKIQHSACYCKYGLKRTGCAGCPFGSRFEDELAAAEWFEPKLFQAANAIFGESYAYTREYRLFKKDMEYQRRTGNENQLELEGFSNAV